MSKTCYMCDKDATTKEHVPPKSFFPEPEVIGENGQVREETRKNLIKVPACEEHNTEKSNEDVFIRNVLLMNQDTNKVGQRRFTDKVIPAMDKDRTLLKEFVIDSQPVVIEDEDGQFETNKMTGDMNRINAAFEMMGRALFFHHFKEKWLSKLWVFPLFAFAAGWDGADEYNQTINGMRLAADKRFLNTTDFGENKSVFYYNVIQEIRGIVMRLNFYSDVQILLYFLPETKQVETSTGVES